MRNMSFMLTADQFIARTKTVTRRLGWKDLKPGTVLRGVRKGMGLKKGETVESLGLIRVVDVRRESLAAIEAEPGGAVREGFPGMTGTEFVRMFAEHMKCDEFAVVTRIEFEHIDGEVA